MIKDRLAGFGLFAGAFAAFALAGSICILAASLTYVGATLSGVHDSLPDIGSESLAADLVDQETEAGYFPAALDPSDPLLSQRKIVVTTAINERTSRDVVEKLFYLDSTGTGDHIDLFIASPGGWLDAAFTIIDAIESVQSKVNTHCLGGCYSAGSMILVAGTGTRTISRNALVMVHANLDDSSEPYSFERLALKRFHRLYQEKAHLPDDWYPLTGEDTYYLSPDEAKGFGLVDVISDHEPPSENPTRS